MLLFKKHMNFLNYLFNSNKKNQSNHEQSSEQNKRDALIQTGRQQFKKLQELGLQIPIAVL